MANTIAIDVLPLALSRWWIKDGSYFVLKGRGYWHRLSVAGNRPLVAIDTDRRVGILYKTLNIFEKYKEKNVKSK